MASLRERPSIAEISRKLRPLALHASRTNANTHAFITAIFSVTCEKSDTDTYRIKEGYQDSRIESFAEGVFECRDRASA